MNSTSNSKISNLFLVTTSETGATLEALAGYEELPSGYSNLVPVVIGDEQILYAYTKESNSLDVYKISDSAPYFEKVISNADYLAVKEWDLLSTFVLGNKNYILAYEKLHGFFGFYEIYDDYSLSKNPYLFANKRDWPTQNFTTVEALDSLGLIYICCYDYNSGTVGAFSLNVVSSTNDGTPALNMLNVWYHHWAKNWDNFVFFQFGGSNFFFKINKGKLNVNIDHLQDNPANGSVEVGSYLQDKLPSAKEVKVAAKVPWVNKEPHFITYNPTSKEANLYKVHADCQGWTNLAKTKINDALIIISYRVNNQSFILFYN